jgi:hypothetical protein
MKPIENPFPRRIKSTAYAKLFIIYHFGSDEDKAHASKVCPANGTKYMDAHVVINLYLILPLLLI